MRPGGIKAGTLLILESPVFEDRFLVARAHLDSTASYVTVQVWHPREGWSVPPQTTRRRLGCVVSECAPGADPAVVWHLLETARRQYNHAVDDAKFARKTAVIMAAKGATAGGAIVAGLAPDHHPETTS